MNTDYYDYIIIGTGISGLYSAYLIKKKNLTSSILILDKEKKEWIGGRTQNEEFYNTTIVTGAGVARKNKDKLLFKLINELNINNIHESIAQTNFANTIKHPVNILKIINELKKYYNKLKIKPNITFKEFAKPILGKELYKYFTICTGYTDYEKEDVYEVLFNYGMDDNIPGWKLIMVPWKELILKLVNFIGSNNIKSLHNVIEIKKIENEPYLFECICENRIKSYFAKNIIIATTISSVLKLLPNFPMYNHIKGQPFLRVYGKFTKTSSNILKQFVPCRTIVPSALHSIIPMKNDVYMIAYTDNDDAIMLKDYIKNNVKNRKVFVDLLEKSLGIEHNTLDLIAIKGFYWPIGTHYFEPFNNNKIINNKIINNKIINNKIINNKNFLKVAQNPCKGIFVVGEMVSTQQGWVEGALESVNAIKSKFELRYMNKS
jgi:hypothetical protein